MSPRRSLAAERAPADPPPIAVVELESATSPAEDALPAEICAALDSLLETVGKAAAANNELIKRAAHLAIEAAPSGLGAVRRAIRHSPDCRGNNSGAACSSTRKRSMRPYSMTLIEDTPISLWSWSRLTPVGPCGEAR